MMSGIDFAGICLREDMHRRYAFMDRIKIWPHATLIVLGCAIVAGVAALLWTKYERTAEARALPNAARIERVDGQVGLNHSLDTSSTKADWIEATANTPITVGDRVYARDNSRSEIAFSGRNFATIDANTSLDILDLSQPRTQSRCAMARLFLISGRSHLVSPSRLPLRVAPLIWSSRASIKSL